MIRKIMGNDSKTTDTVLSMNFHFPALIYIWNNAEYCMIIWKFS